MLAKIVVHGPRRMEARHGLCAALRECELSGLETNLGYLRQVCEHPPLAAGGVPTSFLSDFPYHPPSIVVTAPGNPTQSQGSPGRCGHCDVAARPRWSPNTLAVSC